MIISYGPGWLPEVVIVFELDLGEVEQFYLVGVVDYVFVVEQRALCSLRRLHVFAPQQFGRSKLAFLRRNVFPNSFNKVLVRNIKS